MGLLQSTIQRGVEASGPAGGVEAVLRLAYGDTTYEALDPIVRQGLRGNADVFSNIEPAVFNYRPDEIRLAALKVPVYAVSATEAPKGGAPFPFFSEIAEWIASRLNTRPGTIPGRHGAYIDHPEEVADALRPMLRQMNRNP